MRERLAGKSAFVTGAGRGIGQVIAALFAEEGASVWATSRSPDPLRELTETRGVRTRVLDVTDAGDVAAAARETGFVDILVNCAGVVPVDTPLTMREEVLDETLDINVKGTIRAIRAFLPAMIEARQGAIVNVASVVSSVSAARQRFSYATSKAAVIGLTKSVALEHADDGIRCNAICPGAIESPSLEARIAAAEDSDRARAEMIARHRLRRIGRPEEVAELALYLASDAGGFVTGQAIVVDGGMTI